MRKIFLILFCVSSVIVYAVDEDIIFYGILLLLLICSISGGKIIEVEFCDFIIDDINGNYGCKEVLYEFICDLMICYLDWEMIFIWIGI